MTAAPMMPACKPTVNAVGIGSSAWLGHVVLFVQHDSHYKSLGLDCYDEARDARTYAGSLPVIAHPPCQLWGKMANVNFARWGGEHNRPGNDGGTFRFAIDAVNRCGGVIEHPAESYAWPAHGLQRGQRMTYPLPGVPR